MAPIALPPSNVDPGPGDRLPALAPAGRELQEVLLWVSFVGAPRPSLRRSGAGGGERILGAATKMLDPEVSLSRDSEDFGGALAKSSEFIAVYEASGRFKNTARARFTRATTCELTGEAEQAVEILERAEYLVNSSPRRGGLRHRGPAGTHIPGE